MYHTENIRPTYYGYIGSREGALLVIQAILDKRLEAVPRRPTELERPSLITSGNVFVFIEEDSGIKRWTDGVPWSASRILGRFLIYRELDNTFTTDKKTKKRKASISWRNTGHGDNKAHDLIKKTFSVNALIPGPDPQSSKVSRSIHLISYYSVDDIINGKLQQPQEVLKDVKISRNLWESSNDSSFGAKTPIDDETFYFLDANYQLQNMMALQKQSQLPLNQPQIPSHNPNTYREPFFLVGGTSDALQDPSANKYHYRILHEPSEQPYCPENEFDNYSRRIPYSSNNLNAPNKVYPMPKNISSTSVAQDYIPDPNPSYANRYSIRSSKPNFQTPQSSYIPYLSATNQSEMPYNQQSFFLMHNSQQNTVGKHDVHSRDKLYHPNPWSNQPHGDMQNYRSKPYPLHAKLSMDMSQGGQFGPLTQSSMLSHVGRPGMKRNSNPVLDPNKVHEGDFNFTPNTESHWYE
ncbi:Piso0_002240 [Millerozyma farinosa CBS 7064]|uniref:Piso0_002240 protein n=1 Tax=Pichia sorbitophila (strain ATCC MYA-4447 / BCRC 22081 / CBS 7064 / NBRC 10061 / NRRL Y-12695) TaxID=559304 RepID=G8YC30_PICSO|nr:Piso0_002240 [Millerozyma farinosa CBS 7064]